MTLTAAFEEERPRLLRLAGRVLDDHAEAEDVVQLAWLRLHGTHHVVHDLPAWLTTVTTRLCLDRLRQRVPEPVPDGSDAPAAEGDPVDEVVRTEAVGEALHVVLDRLSPAERIAFVLHDALAVDFPTIAAALGTTPAAARKLASRARAKVVEPVPATTAADAAVVDAFLAAARGGDLRRLLDLLAPDVLVSADAAAVALGSPARLAGREAVASFFDGAARAAVPVLLGDQPAAAWGHRGEVRVVFDVRIVAGRVSAVVFRAAPDVLSTVRPRRSSVLER